MAEKKSSGWWKWILLIVILLAIGGGIFYFMHNRTPPVNYMTAPVTRDELTQAVTATGTLNPVVNVTVGSQVSGIINKLNVDFNSIVKSNEIIAEIDPSTYEAALAQSKADLANAKANLELQQAEANRSEELYTNKLISRSDYDTAIATLHEAQATVQIKTASVANSTANLGYCKIRSPVDGIVISRAIDLGQTVASSFNTPTLFQIANDLTKMQIDSSVAEADVGGILEGQRVDFTVDAYPYRNFHGSVTQVRNAPTTVNNVVTYDCVIGVTNADLKLKPGMTANVSIIIAQHKNVLTIPNAALRFRPPELEETQTNSNFKTNQISTATTNANFAAGAGHRGGNRARGERPVFHTVYVLSGTANDQKISPVQIKTGISDGLETEVVSGLKEGEQVVTGVEFSDSDSPASNPFGGGFGRGRRR